VCLQLETADASGTVTEREDVMGGAAGDEYLVKVGRIPKELVGVACPKCGLTISQDTEVGYNRDESDFVGYTLSCPQCGNVFNYTLFFS
jgi:predicted RNA-binding Zn-ribbon protein involved in translation (DUF1610 family)